jgi:hypothetical protein
LSNVWFSSFRIFNSSKNAFSKTEYAFTSSFGIFSSQALWIAVPKAVYSLPEK